MSASHRKARLFPLGLFASLVLAAASQAQVVFMPPPAPPPNAVTAPTSKNSARASSQAEITSAFKKTGPLFQRGPIAVRPHLNYRVFYSSGLLNPDQLESDESTIHEISAGSRFDIGQRWTADYTATQSYYSNPIFKNNLSHSATLDGRFSFDNISAGVGARYGTGSPIRVETGRQTKQESYSANANLTYELGDRIFIDTTVTRSMRLTNADIASPQWTDADWRSWVLTGRLNYRITPRLSVGTGMTATFDDVSRGSDMNAYQPNLQITWRPTDRISVNAEGGRETRRIDNNLVGDLKNDVYNASLGYQAFATTSVTVTASRGVTASYFANQITRSTSAGINLSQRLLQRYFLTVGTTRAISDYIATANGFTAARRDRYSSYNGRLSTVLFTRGSLGLFFQHGQNATNAREFQFSSDQYGMEFSYQF